MILANFLSRYEVNTKEKCNHSIKDVFHCIGTKDLRIEKLLSFKNESSRDECLGLILEYSRSDCPKNFNKAANDITRFIKIKHKFEMSENLLYYNSKLIVPKDLRKYILLFT